MTNSLNILQSNYLTRRDSEDMLFITLDMTSVLGKTKYNPRTWELLMKYTGVKK